MIPRHPDIRHDWQVDTVVAVMNQSLPDLIHRAQSVHRRWFDPSRMQLSTLASIKTGGCPEDCAYCPQSVHYKTDLSPESLMSVDAVRGAARRAREAGATRFCMGAAWRQPTDANLERVIERIRIVRSEGLEVCATLGMLGARQAARLAEAGLNFYNHNLDTSPAYYKRVISSRSYQDRLDTLGHVRAAGLKVCCGGILGMGESAVDRAELLCQLANFDPQPESVPINRLVRVTGTPLGGASPIDPLDIVRVVAAARIMMPAAFVRLSAGRSDMDDSTQALCFVAGANSVFYGDVLLTTDNPAVRADRSLLARLGMAPYAPAARPADQDCCSHAGSGGR